MIYNEFGDELLSTDEIDHAQLRKDYLASKKEGSYGEWQYAVHPSSLGRISFKLLRYLYEVSPAIRPAVDSIVREVSTLPHMILHEDERFHDPKESLAIREFLRFPNTDNYDLPTINAQFIMDMLVIGKGVIEKVRNPFGKLMELVPRDASLFAPRLNQYGFIQEYIEYERDTTTPKARYPKDDIIFKFFAPNSYSFGSVPIIETIVNEVALLMLSTKSLGWAFTRDEIPPGVLSLGEIGEVALNRAKASFEAAKGIATQHKLRVVDNVKDVKWVELTRSNRDMQVAELLPIIEKIVFRNFGLSPVESSQTDVTRNVAETSWKSSQSKLTLPMMEWMQNIYNNEVIYEFNPKFRLKYKKEPQADPTVAAKIVNEVDSGLLTRNEARITLGRIPVPGGDRLTIKLGNEVVPLDEKTGEPQYRNPPAPVAGRQQAATQQGVPLPTAKKPAAIAKPTKKDVHYIEKGQHQDGTIAQDKAGYVEDGRCVSCKYYNPDNATQGTCDLVAGIVAAIGSCDLFDPAQPDKHLTAEPIDNQPQPDERPPEKKV